MFTVTHLTTNYVAQAVGLQTQAVRFGWRSESTESDWKQQSYRLTVATEESRLNKPDLWDSGTVTQEISQGIVYAGKPLVSGTPYVFRVTVTAASGETAQAQSTFEMGLLHEEFTAKWIAQPKARAGWASCLRRTFTVKGPLLRARAYYSGLGVSELYCNGVKMGDALFDPAQTNYKQIVPYVVRDVTAALKPGENALGVLLGDGWFNQSRVWTDASYGECRLLLELHLYYADGTVEKVLSDEQFRCDYSPITLNNVYGGETYDARLEQPGWCEAGFDDRDWKAACAIEAPGGRLTCLLLPPIRKCREVRPASVRELHQGSNDHVFVYDMGENFAGFVRIQIPPSPAGTEYVLRFAEDVDELGELWYSSTGGFATCVLQQDRYIAKGDPDGESWEPRFTYHGFRYVEVAGLYAAWPEEPVGFDERSPQGFLTGYAVNTDLQSTGTFSCSDERLNALQTLTRRTILSNYHGYPEDCPVRERCGWLGDAQLVCEAAICNFDMAAAYEKYLEDLRTTREEFGGWVMISPGRRVCHRATPLWASAQVLIPWYLYLYYGDTAALQDTYGLMKELVDRLQKEDAINFILHFGLGDWCPPGGNYHNPRRVPIEVSSTAEFYQMARLTSKTAAVLGEKEDAARYDRMAENIRRAFREHFYDAAFSSYGTMGGDGAALRYGLCEPEERAAVAADCLRLLREADGAMGTGIWGNKHLVPAMTEEGHGDAMMHMLLDLDHISFGTMLRDGATSVWECLETPQRYKEIASLNHPMQAAFTSWLYSHILGIQPMEATPGFREFTLTPYVFGGLSRAKGSMDTLYGTIAVSWSVRKGVFALDVTVPANTVAHCTLKGVSGAGEPRVWSVSGKEERTAVSPQTEEDGVRLGSGRYHLEAAL